MEIKTGKEIHDELVRIIAGKMYAEYASTVCDEEIHRTLGGCVQKTKLIKFAKENEAAIQKELDYLRVKEALEDSLACEGW